MLLCSGDLCEYIPMIKKFCLLIVIAVYALSSGCLTPRPWWDREMKKWVGAPVEELERAIFHLLQALESSRVRLHQASLVDGDVSLQSLVRVLHLLQAFNETEDDEDDDRVACQVQDPVPPG